MKAKQIEQEIEDLKHKLEMLSSAYRHIETALSRYMDDNLKPNFKVGEKVSLRIPNETRYEGGCGFFGGGGFKVIPFRTLHCKVIESVKGSFGYLYKVVDKNGRIWSALEYSYFDTNVISKL